ncbi:MAG: hypothetical protein H6581_21995 [Bacteroidia bacterium]|nr:hypothetical protein [Bacteroidia bacterium]
MKKLVSFLVAFRGDFVAAKLHQPGLKEVAVAVAGGLTAALVLLALMPKAILNADMYEYYRQALDPAVPRNAEHLGFIWLLESWLKISPFSGEMSMNLLNALFGWGCLSLVYLLGWRLWGRWQPGLLAAAVLGMNFVFAFNAFFPEIYVVQTCFLLATVYLVLLDRSFPGGICFVAAFAMSPSSLLALPMILLLLRSKRQAGWLALSLALGLGLYLGLNPEALFSPKMEGAMALNWMPGRAVLITFHKVVRGFLYLLPFAALGLVEIWKRKELRWFLLMMFVLFLPQTLLGQRFYDVPVNLVTWCLLALPAGLGLETFVRGNQRFPAGFWLAFPLMGLLEWVSWSFHLKPVVGQGAILTGLGLAVGLVSLGFWWAGNGLVRIAVALGLAGLVAWHSCLRIVFWRNFALERQYKVQAAGKPGEGTLVLGKLEMWQAFRHEIYSGKNQDFLLETRELEGNGDRDMREVWEQALQNGQQILLLEDLPEIENELVGRGYVMENFGSFLLAKRGF